MNKTRRWTYGKMFLYEKCIKYLENNSKNSNEKAMVVVRFTSINLIKRATSSLIFNCIVFVVDGTTLWFSSFPNRDHVFNMLEHFHKACLIGGTTRKARPTDDLMRLVYDTQDTLMNAASTLHKQGQQLNKASQTMGSLVDNIKVAERITDDINSWFGAWRVKAPFRKSSNKQENQRQKQYLNKGRIEYPILFAKHQQESHTDGFLVVLENGLQVMNNKSELQHTFVKAVDNTSAEVHSPFDMTLFSKQKSSNMKLHLVSSEMPQVLNTLRTVCQIQCKFDSIPDGNPVVDGLSDEKNIGFQTDITGSANKHENKEIRQPTQQQQQSNKDLPNEDADQLLSVLQNIKSLALDVGSEQDAQMQQIDSIDRSIDRAEARLSSTNYKINKML